MRRVSARLKYVLTILTVVSVYVLVGCSSSSTEDDGTIKPGSGVALNPGGKTQDPAMSTYASQMQKTGSAMNAQMQKDAAAMAAAKARSNGQ